MGEQYASSLYENKLKARLDCLMLGSGSQSNYVVNSYKVICNPFHFNTDNYLHDGLINNLNLVSDHLPAYIDIDITEPDTNNNLDVD